MTRHELAEAVVGILGIPAVIVIVAIAVYVCG